MFCESLFRLVLGLLFEIDQVDDKLFAQLIVRAGESIELFFEDFILVIECQILNFKGFHIFFNLFNIDLDSSCVGLFPVGRVAGLHAN